VDKRISAPISLSTRRRTWLWKKFQWTWLWRRTI